MTVLRRTALFCGALFCGALSFVVVLAGLASAQTVDPLKLFVPAAPGGGWDQTARTMEMALKAGGIVKNIQIENVAGAGGTVGLPRFVAKKGDGSTLMVAGMVMVGSTIANKSPTNLSQVTPIARLTSEYLVVAVPASSPHKTFADLVQAIKADPGKVSWAGGSAGGSDHILIGLIFKTLGLDPKKLAYVAYSGGGPAVAAIIGGQVTAGVSGYGEFSEQIAAGKMRLLAISSEKRIPGIDAPTLREQGVDVVLGNWRGVFAPPQLKPEQRKALIDTVERLAKSPQWQDEIRKRDWAPAFLAGDEFSAFLGDDMKRIEAILRDVGLAN